MIVEQGRLSRRPLPIHPPRKQRLNLSLYFGLSRRGLFLGELLIEGFDRLLRFDGFGWFRAAGRRGLRRTGCSYAGAY